MPKYMSSVINYETKQKALASFQTIIECGNDAVLSKDGLTITFLQDTPVQHGQVEWIGDKN